MGTDLDAGRAEVMARAELTFRFSTQREAEVIWDAVSADDPSSLEGRVEGETVHVVVPRATAPSVRVSVDDLLACMQAARGGVVAPEDEDEGEVG